MTIKSGVYQNVGGNGVLYFVLGVAWSNDKKCRHVVLHSLGNQPDQVWQTLHLRQFQRSVRKEYFKRIMGWQMPNILPGHVWIDPQREIGKIGQETHLSIVEVYSIDGKLPIVILSDYQGILVHRTLIYLATSCIYTGIVRKGES